MAGVRVKERGVIPFFMVGKPDLQRLAVVADSRLLPYARSVYFALLEIANDQRAVEASVSRAELASRAGVSTATLKRCVPLLVEAALVEVEEVAGHPNIWTLVRSDGGGSSGAGSGGSDRAGGRVQQSRGSALVEPGLKETSQEGKKDPTGLKKTSSGGALIDVWEHYLSTFGRRFELTPARRLVIQQALKVRSADECKAAITGLSKSDYHVSNGLKDIRYALRGGGHSPSADSTIDRMAALAASSNGNGNGAGPRFVREKDENGFQVTRSPNGERLYFGLRRFGELSTNEKRSAQEMIQMGQDPADRSTW